MTDSPKKSESKSEKQSEPKSEEDEAKSARTKRPGETFAQRGTEKKG